MSREKKEYFAFGLDDDGTLYGDPDLNDSGPVSAAYEGCSRRDGRSGDRRSFADLWNVEVAGSRSRTCCRTPAHLRRREPVDRAYSTPDFRGRGDRLDPVRD